MRKVIQISAVPGTEEDYSSIFALCDDGTMWQKQWIHNHPERSNWEELPEIPSPGEPKTFYMDKLPEGTKELLK